MTIDEPSALPLISRGQQRSARRLLSRRDRDETGLFLAEGAQALAMLRARASALPEDMLALAPDVLRHRISLSYEALAEGWDGDRLVAALLEKVPVP